MKQEKRLGRGLAALMGDAAPVAAGVQRLGIEALEPSPFQPRREMDEAALAELAASVRQRGILQPLLVRSKPGEPGRFQIIAGERRWRAAQKIQLHEVPVLLRELTDPEAMVAGLVENLQRADLNPVEEASGLARLLKEFNMTQDGLAEAVGKSRAHIGNSLRILLLPPSVLALVREGRISFGHARALSAHPNPTALANRIVKEGLSVRQTESLLAGGSPKSRRREEGEPARARMPEIADPETEALARQLSEKLGMAVKITFNGVNGAISIGYRSLDQLDEVLALLNR